MLANTNATRGSYPSELRSILSAEKARESGRWLSSWSGINPGPTPLYALDGLAHELGLAAILLKDESVRSPLRSFKALGAPMGLVRLILRLWPHEKMSAERLFAGAYASLLRDFAVISATDGNHGRALAAAAHSIGCRCVIVLHAKVNDEREAAIAAYGAEIVRIDGDYDESVKEASRLARMNGWHVVSDTSYAGYEEIPRDVMQGYAMIAAEVIDASSSDRSITHVFAQGGVGGFPAALVSYFWEVYEEKRPVFVVVEPEQADCLYQSALQGTPASASGSVDSVMAGLACGEASPLAWRFLMPGADFFMTVRDEDAVRAMQVLAVGSELDPPVVAGESGAAGLAGLLCSMQDGHLARNVGLGGDSRVLVINTEGATAPTTYRQLTGESFEEVLLRQRAFLDSAADHST